MGLNGAFLTADLFNLFVFFEVLLIASYGLLLHGAGAVRLRASVHYVVFNLTGSALFLIAVSTLYGLTGTLNMADLAQRMPPFPLKAPALVQAAALLLIVVFGVKAATAAAVLLADRHLPCSDCAGGGTVRHHDQGRRLLHRSCNHTDVRR